MAFGGTRTYHRLACAIEDAGFELRDCIMWLYGSGFPKGEGCLKPAYEPIVLARRPGPRVLPLGIEECRVTVAEGDEWNVPQPAGGTGDIYGFKNGQGRGEERSEPHPAGRWPANVTHDGSDEVLETFAAFGESKSSNDPNRFRGTKKFTGRTMATDAHSLGMEREDCQAYGDTGTAARFFYCAKASKAERERGLDNIEIVTVESCQEGKQWERGDLLVKLRVDTEPSPPRVTVGYGTQPSDDTGWNTFLFGNGTTAPCLAGRSSTTATRTKSTIESRTLSWLTRSLTSASIQVVSSERESGGSHAENAEPSTPSLTITLASPVSLPGVGRVVSGTRLKISGNVHSPADHPTVKPLDLMRWLVRLVCPRDGRLLDPFAGSGTTGLAADLEFRKAVLIEKDPAHCEIIRRRLSDRTEGRLV